MENDYHVDESTDITDVPVIPDGYFDVNAEVATPEYHVEEASSKLELYTLKEAIADERFVEMFAPLFAAGVVSRPEAPFVRGLVIFAQPQMDEGGEFFEHSAELSARCDTPAQDLIVVIARTSAEVKVALDVKGVGKLSRTLVVLAQEDAKVRVHTRASEGAEGELCQSLVVIAGDHAKVTIEETGVTSTVRKILAGSAELVV